MASRSLTGRDAESGRPIRVTVNDGVVADVRLADPAAVDDVWLSAGFVDLQVNGFAGVDVNGEPGVEGLVAMAYALIRVGVTTFVPTIITASEAGITAALRGLVAARAADPVVARAIPYAHVEGPNLSDQDGARGAHPIGQIRPPSVEEFERWQTACDGLIGTVTISPHWPETQAYVETLVRKGIRVSVGHTHATPEQVHAAADAGARFVTHLGNGVHANLPRHPNYLWAQLADDRLTVGLIADGHHLPADTLRVALRAKGLDRVYLVSDATSLAGLEPGRYRQPIGGEVELGADGRLSMVGTPLLAGAALPVTAGVATVAGLEGYGLGDGVRLATRSPGRFVGPGDSGGSGGSGGSGSGRSEAGRGVLRPGAPADLVRFGWAPGDPRLDLRDVLVGGEELPA